MGRNSDSYVFSNARNALFHAASFPQYAEISCEDPAFQEDAIHQAYARQAVAANAATPARSVALWRPDRCVVAEPVEWPFARGRMETEHTHGPQKMIDSVPTIAAI